MYVCIYVCMYVYDIQLYMNVGWVLPVVRMFPTKPGWTFTCHHTGYKILSATDWEGQNYVFFILSWLNLSS